jgi:integrase
MDLVFPNARGKPHEPNNLVMRVLHPTLDALGLTKTGWGAFRRSVAAALSEMREPVRTAQQILGHSSVQMRRQRWPITFSRWKSLRGVRLRN